MEIKEGKGWPVGLGPIYFERLFGSFSISMLCEFQYLMLKLVLERLSYIYIKVVSYMVYHSRVLSVCHFIPGLYGNCAGNFICMTDG